MVSLILFDAFAFLLYSGKGPKMLLFRATSYTTIEHILNPLDLIGSEFFKVCLFIAFQAFLNSHSFSTCDLIAHNMAAWRPYLFV